MPKCGPADVDGTRFCSLCGSYQSLDKFSAGKKRRYMCRAHVASVYRKTYRDNLKRPAASIFYALDRMYRDAREVYQVHAKMSCEDLRTIIKSPEQSVLPQDPLQPISPTNYVLIEQPWVRTMLNKCWQTTHCARAYEQTLLSLVVPPSVGDGTCT